MIAAVRAPAFLGRLRAIFAVVVSVSRQELAPGLDDEAQRIVAARIGADAVDGATLRAGAAGCIAILPVVRPLTPELPVVATLGEVGADLRERRPLEPDLVALVIAHSARDLDLHARGRLRLLRRATCGPARPKAARNPLERAPVIVGTRSRIRQPLGCRTQRLVNDDAIATRAHECAGLRRGAAGWQAGAPDGPILHHPRAAAAVRDGPLVGCVLRGQSGGCGRSDLVDGHAEAGTEPAPVRVELSVAGPILRFAFTLVVASQPAIGRTLHIVSLGVLEDKERRFVGIRESTACEPRCSFIGPPRDRVLALVLEAALVSILVGFGWPA